MKNQTPADRQTELRQSGLLASPDEIWSSPCGTFVLAPHKPSQKKRGRINLGASAR